MTLTFPISSKWHNCLALSQHKLLYSDTNWLHSSDVRSLSDFLKYFFKSFLLVLRSEIDLVVGLGKEVAGEDEGSSRGGLQLVASTEARLAILFLQLASD